MNVPHVACTNCGKPFTTDDLRGTSCRYCGTLLAHRARAQEQVAVIQEMFRSGTLPGPGALPPGAMPGPYPYPPPYGPSPSPYVPPPFGYGPSPNVGNVGQEVTRAVSRAMLIAVTIIVVVLFMSFAAGFALFFLARP
jgi:hypothetical protein